MNGLVRLTQNYKTTNSGTGPAPLGQVIIKRRGGVWLDYYGSDGVRHRGKVGLDTPAMRLLARRAQAKRVLELAESRFPIKKKPPQLNKTPSMTARYAHLSHGFMQDAVTRLDDDLDPAMDPASGQPKQKPA